MANFLIATFRASMAQGNTICSLLCSYFWCVCFSRQGHFLGTTLVSLLVAIKLPSLLSGRRLFGLAAALTALIWVSAAGTYLYPIYTALCLILMATSCLVCHWQRGKKRWIAIAGVLIGVTVLFRHDMAMYSVLAICAGECFHHLGASGQSLRLKCQELLRDVIMLVACILIIAAPAILLLLRHVPVADIRYQMFYIPSKIYPGMRHLPFFRFPLGLSFAGRIRSVPGQSFVLVPILVPLAAGGCLAQKGWRGRQPHWQVSGYVLLLCLALVMPISGVVRPDLAHVVSALVIDSVLLASLAAKSTLSTRVGRAIIAGVAVCFLLGLTVQAWRAGRQAKKTAVLFTHPGRLGSLISLCHPPAGLERMRCMQLDPIEEEEVEYIQQHTSPGEDVYSGVGRHDKLFLNDILFYFISKREAPQNGTISNLASRLHIQFRSR